MRVHAGVVFGHKLKSQQEINQNLGIAETPAPGGNTRVPSFVEEDRAQNKGTCLGRARRLTRGLPMPASDREPANVCLAG